MANWLEAEEHKKALLLRREQAVHEKEETVHRLLTTFYDLCTRVNGVRPGSLSISRLKVEGRSFTIREAESDGDGGTMWVSGTRGIRVSCPNQDEVFIDGVIFEHHYNVDRVCGDISSARERVLIRKTCAIQDLSDWQEDQILLAFQWMSLESEDIKESIPGTKILIDETVAEAEARQKALQELEAKRNAPQNELKRLKEKLESKTWFGWLMDGLNGGGHGLDERKMLKFHIEQLEKKLAETHRYE